MHETYQTKYRILPFFCRHYPHMPSRGGGGGGEGVAKGFVLYLLDSPLALAIKYFKVFYPISVLVFVEQLVCDQNPCGINEKCKEIWAIGSLHRCESKFRFAACFGFESIKGEVHRFFE